MLTNHLYDLIEQLTHESKSLWRIEQYVDDAEGCGDCAEFWRRTKADKEAYVAELSDLIQGHMQRQPAPMRATVATMTV